MGKTERQQRLEEVREELGGDAMLVVVLRDPDPEGAPQKQSITVVGREDAIVTGWARALGTRVRAILSDAFDKAGLIHDFVQRGG